jgi:hypothetical protein
VIVLAENEELCHVCDDGDELCLEFIGMVGRDVVSVPVAWWVVPVLLRRLELLDDDKGMYWEEVLSNRIEKVKVEKQLEVVLERLVDDPMLLQLLFVGGFL